MKHWVRGKHLFYTFLVSYLIVFLLPLVVGFILYAGQKKTLVNETMQSAALRLQHAEERINQKIDSILLAGQVLSADSSIRRYLTLQGPIAPAEREYSADVIHALSNSARACGTDTVFYLYARNTDAILTQTALYSPELFYKYCCVFADILYKDLLDQLRGDNYWYFHVQTAIHKELTTETPVVMISQSLPKDLLYAPQAILFTQIKQTDLLKLFGEQQEDTHYLLLDIDNNVLASDGGIRIADKELLHENEGNLLTDLDGEKYLLSYCSTDILSWKLVIATKQAAIYKHIYQQETIFLAAYFTCLLLGSVLAWHFARYQYSPLKSIVDSIDRYTQSQSNEGVYEYISSSLKNSFYRNDELEKTLERSLDENKRFTDLIVQSRGSIQSSLINALLFGTLSDTADAAAFLSLYDIELPYDQFVVLVIRLGDPAAPAEDTFSVLSDSMEDLTTDIDAVYYTVRTQRNTAAILLNAMQIQESALENTLVELCRIQAAQTGGRPTGAYGSIQSSVFDLSLSYHDACERLDAQETQMDGEHQETSTNQFSSDLSLVHYAQELIQCGKTDDLRSALAVQMKVWGDGVHAVMHLSHILLLLQEEHGNTDVMPSAENMEQLLNAPPEERDTLVFRMIEAAVSRLMESERQTQDPIALQIRRFIGDHITDASLSQAMIAEQFGMSQSNVSKVFKKAWNVNMVDYINQARVVRCLRLLKETRLSLNEIAERVGFSNSRTMIRVFKKYEEITPSQYRTIEQLRIEMMEQSKERTESNDQQDDSYPN